MLSLPPVHRFVPVYCRCYFLEGGYDKRVPENVDHLSELEACAARLGLDSLVEFRTNVADGKAGARGKFVISFFFCFCFGRWFG